MDYSNWTTDDLTRLRGTLAAEGAEPEERDAVAREIRRRESAPTPAPADGRTQIPPATNSDWSSKQESGEHRSFHLSGGPHAETEAETAKGFFGSLFDYSFSSFITSKIIEVLYALTTIVAALGTLAIILVAYQASSTLGILALLVGGPIFFLIAMIYARFGLELVIVIFRIHENVQEINQRAGGARGTH